LIKQNGSMRILNQIVFLVVVALAGVFNSAQIAIADAVYTNGPINGTLNAYTINESDSVTDTVEFSVPASTNLTSAQVGLWVVATDSPTSLDWSIGTSAFANDVSSGASAALSNTLLTPTNDYGNGGEYYVYASTFSLNGALTAGTKYWLTLYNATSQNNNYVFWDVNNGPSSAEQSLGGTPIDVNSEAFTLFSDSATVPEPSEVVALSGLFGMGLIGVVWRRRKSA